jgi:hypothetical protein
MTQQEQLATPHDRHADDWKEQVKKESVHKGITASQQLGQKKLGELATLNGISLTKKLDNRKERPITIAELIDEISATYFWFQ